MNTSITLNQRKRIVCLMEDSLNAMRLDENEAQLIIERGDAIQAELKHIFFEFSVFPEEDVSPSYAYPCDYQVKGVADQLSILRQLFPELNDATFNEDIATQSLPDNAEGWFAIPRWEKIAKTYGEAVVMVLAMIKQTRDNKLNRISDERLGPDNFRQCVRTVEMFQKLGDEQKGHDILIVPCQFGLRHCNYNVLFARQEFTANEFGLGTFVVGMMLLTHPKRLVLPTDFWVDCSGDDYRPPVCADRGLSFFYVPCFGFRYDVSMLNFSADNIGDIRDNSGSASGFLP